MINKYQLPDPPFKGSIPEPEIKVSLPELAVMMLVPALPVAVSALVPVKVRLVRLASKE